ncbi:MAG: VCBS repeat-containing protein, partial [Actinobacteria bacterium]|nr:VCBS repeat-containing protein [Actinomycetota bacterium]
LPGGGVRGVEYIQPEFTGAIPLDGIEVGHSFEVRYTLVATALGFPFGENYAEAYIGDPLEYGSGIRMAYGEFGELPVITDVTTDGGAGAWVGFDAREGFYYILYRDGVPVAVALTQPGPDELFDPSAPPGVTADDYTVENQPLDEPLDLDGDGIDDVFELLHPDILDPLDSSDAHVDHDGDGRSNLLEYLEGTDLAVPDASPASDNLYPAPIFDPGLFVRAIGDVDLDGVADLTGDRDGELAVALGLGDGRFEPPILSAFPEHGSIDGAVADLNGDGFLEIVFADRSNDEVRVMLGDGLGGFTPGDAYAVGDFPHRITTVDVDGDGLADVVTTNRTARSVSVLLGNGDGTLQAAIDTVTDQYGTPQDTTVADLDGDEPADLLVAFSGNQVGVFPGNGDGTFGDVQGLSAGVSPIRVVAADVDDDGNADIVILNDYGVSILLGNGDGTFDGRVDYGTGDDPRELAVKDLDADSDLDVVIGHLRSHYHAILLNDGAGSFSAQTPAFTNGSLNWFLADFTGDGRPDLLTRTDTGYSLSPGLEGARFDTRVDTTVPGMVATNYNFAATFDLADVNADGLVDALIPNRGAANSVEVLTNAADGNFMMANSIPLGSPPLALTTGNFDGDGGVDVAAVTERPNLGPGDSRNQLHILVGDGSGGFTAKEPIELTDRPSEVATGDLDGDGLDDVVVALLYAGTAAPFISQGDGTFSAEPLLDLGGYARGPRLVDLDGDGRDDLVISVTGAPVAVYLADATGRLFAVPDAFPAGSSGDNLAFHDVTGDGLPDLIGSLPTAEFPRLEYYAGHGDGTFEAAETLLESYAGEVRHLTFVDVNGDGLPDLNGGAEIRLARDEGGFDEPQSYFGGDGGGQIIRDVNGDGQPDRIGVLGDLLQVLLHR